MPTGDAFTAVQRQEIAKAIAETGFDGYFAHEYIPSTKDRGAQIAGLAAAAKLCTV